VNKSLGRQTDPTCETSQIITRRPYRLNPRNKTTEGCNHELRTSILVVHGYTHVLARDLHGKKPCNYKKNSNSNRYNNRINRLISEIRAN